MDPSSFPSVIQFKPSVSSHLETIYMRSLGVDTSLRPNIIVTFRVAPPPVQSGLPVRLRLNPMLRWELTGIPCPESSTFLSSSLGAGNPLWGWILCLSPARGWYSPVLCPPPPQLVSEIHCWSEGVTRLITALISAVLVISSNYHFISAFPPPPPLFCQQGRATLTPSPFRYPSSVLSMTVTWVLGKLLTCGAKSRSTEPPVYVFGQNIQHPWIFLCGLTRALVRPPGYREICKALPALYLESWIVKAEH